MTGGLPLLDGDVLGDSIEELKYPARPFPLLIPDLAALELSALKSASYECGFLSCTTMGLGKNPTLACILGNKACAK